MFSFSHFSARADKIIEHILQDISTLRTGRATTSLLDSVIVEAYGTKMKVHELASVSVPDPTLLVISPWDKSLLDAIAKGVQVSSLGFNPVVDSDIIRISVPPLTAERRHEMVKLLAQKIESGKVMLRNLRSEIRKDIEVLEGEDGVSVDNISSWQEELDRKVKEVELKIEEMKKKKEEELLKI